MTKIFKDDVIEALATEPKLTFGTFIEDEFKYDDDLFGVPFDRPYKDCAVCAVGSVLRPHYTNNYDLENKADDLTPTGVGPHHAGRIKPGDWMSALSVFWESLGAKGCPVEEARAITIDWIEETFPEDEVLAVI